MIKPVHILFPLVFICFLDSSCKKIVENEKQDLLVKAMTSGLWHIETFEEDSTMITGQFTGYNFQFYENGTVTGLKDSLVEEGIWTTDIQNYSIVSNFPSSSDPVKKLNGTWKITDTSNDYVVAEMSGAHGKNILHLRKTL